MFEIKRKFKFSAAHKVAGLPNSPQCARMHGHTYSVEVVLAGDFVDKNGVLIDFEDIKAFKQFIDAELDHRCLNTVWKGIVEKAMLSLPDIRFKAFAKNPTTEALAYMLFYIAKRIFPLTVAVTVCENEHTRVTYRPTP